MENEGRIGKHARDVKHLMPALARVDLMEFVVDVTSAGAFSQPVHQSTSGGYKSQLEEIRGYMQSPGTDPELSGTIYFTIRDQEKKGEMFESKISMGHLVDTAGGGQPLMFENGLYVFDPGSKIEVKFELDGDGTLGYAAQASAAKRWSLLLKFNQFAE